MVVKVNRWDVVTMVIGLAAFCLHLVGTIFPKWWVLHEHDRQGASITYYYGIWKVVECRNGTCVDLPSDMHDSRAWLVGPAVLIILADVLLFTVLVFTAIYVVKSSFNPLFRKLAVLLSAGAALGTMFFCPIEHASFSRQFFLFEIVARAISCIFVSITSLQGEPSVTWCNNNDNGGVVILAVLIFYKKKAGLRPSTAPETTEGDPGWTLFISTSGGILGIVNSIMLGTVVNRRYRSGRRSSVFGIKNVAEMEIDVNALRRGHLKQGENINQASKLSSVPSVSKVSNSYQ